MREIKFRAWEKEDHEMIYNAQATYDFMCTGKGCMAESFQEVIEQTDYFELMQYTGLKDKKGVDIYEGDIVIVTCYSYEQIESESTGEIVYSDALACFALSDGENGFATLSDLKGPYRTDYEVIGNIHNNPDMLNEN